MVIRAFIQARMSSRRFPGKMLAVLGGKSVISHVIDRVSDAVPRSQIVLLTSEEPSDDPLAVHGEGIGVAVLRGSLENVVERFQSGLVAHPCDYFFRVCGDSPLLDPELLRRAADLARDGSYDLVTNVYPRTYPIGNSVEIIRSQTFSRLEPGGMTEAEREHVTSYFYARPGTYSIRNFESGDAALSDQSLCVDTPADLERLEGLMRGPEPLPSSGWRGA